MRLMLTVASVGLLVLSAGCNQNDADLRAELAALKAQQANNSSSSSDERLAMLMASMNKGGDAEALERKVNSLSEDIRAGVSSLKSELKTGQISTEAKIELLETRMDKVTELQNSILTLKTMIESLETKVKNVDPNETLKVHKELTTKEAELKFEKQANQRLEQSLKDAKTDASALQLESDALKEQIAGLEGDDISRHPMYRELRNDLRKVKDDLQVAKDDRDLWRKKHDELLKQIGNGNIPEDVASSKPNDADTTTYDFKGKVLNVASGARPGTSTTVLISISEGTVPPIGAEVVILDSKNTPICHVKIMSHYHVADDSTMPVDSLGGKTIDEDRSKPVTKGDIVVWNKPEVEGNAGGE